MLALAKRLLEAARGGDPVVAATVVDPGATALMPGSKLLIERDGRLAGTLGDPAVEALVAAHALGVFARHAAETVFVQGDALATRPGPGAIAVYIEVVESRPVFLVVGGGHIGRSLAHLASFLDFHVAVIDDREEFANEERLPTANEVICGPYEEALDRYPIGPQVSIVMVTRGHRQDEISLRHCLGRGAGYVGMIGSRRRTATVLRHLAEEGFDPAELARVRTPIGLDIGAETPEEIAVAIMAEVLMFRKGGTGAPMYHRRTSVAER